MHRLWRICVQYFKRTDKLLLAACLASSAIGIILLLGIVGSGYVQSRRLVVQLVATAIGIAVAVVISMIDYRQMAALWKIYVPVSVFFVVLTYFVGEKRTESVDDQAWLKIPFIGTTFQPSELLKIAFILAFALHLEHVKDSIDDPHTLLGLCVHGAIPAILIVLQGDHGTALVFVAIFCCMIFAAGVRARFLAMAAGAAVAVSPLVWFFMLDADKRDRILTIFNPELDPQGIGWQQGLGRLSLGSGQIWGKGIFTDHNYVPEMHNDFIFAYAGEAIGFVGCLLIIALLAVICVNLLRNAKKARDPLGKLICIGVFATIAFQTVVNIGMCLSLFPVVGLTLPFFSAGGTSVVGTYAGIGLVLSVHRYSCENLFIDK